MTTSVLQDLESAQQTRAIAAHRRVRELAHAAASGQPVNTTEVAKALAAAGLPDGAFRIAVEKAEKRIAIRAQIDSLPKQQARKQELEAAIAKVEAEFTAARKAYEIVSPLTCELLTLDNAIISAGHARRELAELADGDPEFEHRERELRQRRLNLAGDERRISQQLDGRYEDTPGRVYKFWFPGRIREATLTNSKLIPKLEAERKKYYEDRVKPLEDDLARVKAQLAELDADEAALKEEKCSI